MAFSEDFDQKFTTTERLHCYTRFLREFRTKNWTRAQILTILKRTVIKTYNSAK